MGSIVYGKEALGMSWQAEFPTKTRCVKCGQDARHVLTAMEESGDSEFACKLHHNDPQGEGFWLHDAAAFAIYLCTDIGCVTATTLWNQA